ncbi:hypothetical protein KUV65_17535 [Maritalea mobilis]|uniref:hypothetical protein n=1 Tax=Maritalea mobilis TaxID=483324 RepID=UPI001C93CD3B|nr:hypothetical protein [Maritalea mobilis]MBY6203175.1 hypothetical protein [Maritalea mobilis]
MEKAKTLKERLHDSRMQHAEMVRRIAERDKVMAASARQILGLNERDFDPHVEDCDEAEETALAS